VNLLPILGLKTMAARSFSSSSFLRQSAECNYNDCDSVTAIVKI
jgi:hypothetical protein